MTPAAAPPVFSVGLLCIYKQYKADTETIADWLKATAVKHGYKSEGQDGWTIRTCDFVPSELTRPSVAVFSGWMSYHRIRDRQTAMDSSVHGIVLGNLLR